MPRSAAASAPRSKLWRAARADEIARHAPPVIRIAAALLVDTADLTLLVRKRGTTAFMQAGGKIEAKETPLDAVLRELSEELGLIVDATAACYLGRFKAPAANEAGWIVDAEMYRFLVDGDIVPAAEIDEILWLGPDIPPGITLAPLTRYHILPLHRAASAERTTVPVLN